MKHIRCVYTTAVTYTVRAERCPVCMYVHHAGTSSSVASMNGLMGLFSRRNHLEHVRAYDESIKGSKSRRHRMEVSISLDL